MPTIEGTRVRWTLALALAAVGIGAAAGWQVRAPAPAPEMAAAAARFLETLTPEQRAKAALPFDGPARTDWHFVPRAFAGIEFGQMDDAQRIAARALMRTALSPQGVNTAEEIMLLDAVLREMEQGKGQRRDPRAYAIAVFGTPGSDRWGWKLEGHHLSLNFTDAGGRVAWTPSFLGASPAEVRAGDRAGVRVLAALEDPARELLASLAPAQRAKAVLGDRAPADVLAVPGRALDEVDLSGLPVGEMDTPQRTLVERLLEEYAGRLRHEFAEEELARIAAAGMERIRFAWMGSDRRGEGSYYRLSGPTFVIEYDNTQDGANHVHTVWRDRARDFGRDALREHVEAGRPGQASSPAKPGQPVPAPR